MSARPLRKRGALWLIAGGLVLTGVVLEAIAFLRPEPFHGTYFDPPRNPAEFTLHSADGPVSLADLRGKIVAMYFGYTFCPDHCPLTFARLAQALRAMGEAAGDVRVVMVTVDPERDTPEVTSEYVRRFSSGFIGLSGTPEEIDAVVKAYGVFVRKRQVESAAGYLVDHTVSVFVLDRSGALTLLWPGDVERDEVAADLRRLVRRRS